MLIKAFKLPLTYPLVPNRIVVRQDHHSQIEAILVQSWYSSLPFNSSTRSARTLTVLKSGETRGYKSGRADFGRWMSPMAKVCIPISFGSSAVNICLEWFLSNHLGSLGFWIGVTGLPIALPAGGIPTIEVVSQSNLLTKVYFYRNLITIVEAFLEDEYPNSGYHLYCLKYSDYIASPKHIL
jgi:hypothetical protein